MKDETNRVPQGKTPAGDAGSAGGTRFQSRRRLIKGGLSAGPVILTLTSRPVLGFEEACVAPSRMISGNFSGFAGPRTCDGALRSDYTGPNKPGSSSAYPAGTSFSTVFGSHHAYNIPEIEDPTLGQVFDDSYPKGTVASYLIAALWNVVDSSQNITVLTPSQIIDMWHGVNSGGYCPQAGMPCWNEFAVIGYLTNSGIVPA
jgi:hypothetical protein